MSLSLPYESASPVQSPTLSIVIPTRDEAGNVEPLVGEISSLDELASVEVVFVDDSTDDTPERIREVGAASELPITLLHRPRNARANDLGGAVVEGFRAANAPWVCVMDGDLQHPPTVIPLLVDEARRTGADLVVASRYAGDRPIAGLNRLRKAVSRVLTGMARLLFPGRLAGVSDPLSGFFLIRRDALDLDGLRPRGFKILVEILVRHPRLRVSEVGFEFGERLAGESKASIREAFTYLSQLVRLRAGELPERFARFTAVGVSGLAVNTLLLAAFADAVGLHYLLAASLATQGSTLWNFVLTEKIVFSTKNRRWNRKQRAVMFFAMNNVALAFRAPILFILVFIGIHYLAANILSLAILGVIRFAISDTFIWKRNLEKRRHFYSVHGIVNIRSEIRLPELERFRVASLAGEATIRVRVGKVQPRATEMTNGRRRIVYEEGFGSLGFAADIAIGRHVDVTVSRLVSLSPHVAYTNVVEPVLRWAFVERGYALVHAACISSNGHALLLTARTDTGKTTTVLKTLAAQPCSFLSDDLTLLRPDGRVLCYPKPLTISRHTVAAVRTAQLTARERIALFVQSRIHSRSGRRFALLLVRAGLPAATINAIVQLLVPPPKVDVKRLVPETTVLRDAQVGCLVVIERGDDRRIDLSESEAVETLLRNCEDAYGFPPYPAIEAFLRRDGGDDLGEREHEIVGNALAGVPATLVVDRNREWWRTVAQLVSGAASFEHPREADLAASLRDAAAGRGPARVAQVLGEE